MAKYVGIFEQAADGTWSGFIPELPAVHATGDTLEHAEEDMRYRIALWVEEMRADGVPIPAPYCHAREFEVTL